MDTLEESNAQLKNAVAARIKNVQAGRSHEHWYAEAPSEASRQPIGSAAFMSVLEELKATHLKKSQDYGDPSDPLANIRSGADVVGIEPWRGCLVRVADKMQRIKSFCREGKLANEGFEDALLDLASYAVIALIMFREGQK
jgi:hypothetical protein